MKRTDSLARRQSDLKLYELLKKGDAASLEHIHTRYKRLLFWVGRQVLDDDFVVESVLQDTFLKLWLHRDTIETPEHIIGFLRFVMKRDCIAYVTAPKNKFNRLTASLERFENYQDYLIGYNPEDDQEQLLSQQSDQKKFDEVKKVLPVIDPKRKHLIELCLQYGFQHKPIAEAMGSSVKDISNELNRAIKDLREILFRSSIEPSRQKVVDTKGQPATLSSQQREIIRRRFEQKSSFALIAKDLKLAEKEVHREFLYACQYLQNEKKFLKSF